jgi:hypothetical protein
MSAGDVVAYLEKLPCIAWPYGLVVAVSENGVLAPGSDERIKRNREALVRFLEEAGVKVELWPSAVESRPSFTISSLDSFRACQCPISRVHCGPDDPETAFLEMKQCVDGLSSERLWCNTAGIRSFEP